MKVGDLVIDRTGFKVCILLGWHTEYALAKLFYPDGKIYFTSEWYLESLDFYKRRERDESR